MDLMVELKRVTTAMDAAGIPYALCGGLAVAVHGFPRATMDIDLLIEEAALDRMKKVAQKLGYTVDDGLMPFANGRVALYRLTMIDHRTGDVLPLDLVLVTPELRLAWDTTETIAWEGGPLRVVSKKGLIGMKRLRGSGQDQDDIARLEED